MVGGIPVVLEGSNLGERYQHFNSIVHSAFQQNLNLKSFLVTDEKSSLDRIYKIDLASKHRDVDYIIHNLKDDDLLYVSRALKCHWLLDPQHRDVINPRHLEEEIFPHMIQPAVNKMRHWLQVHLKDTTRCQDFYEYYKDQHKIAIKFLRHCSPDHILKEMLKVLEHLSPQDLKIFCETCPQAALAYFEGLHTNEKALRRYLDIETSYFESLQCILKLNATLFLDCLEKYFNISKFKPVSPQGTRYILKNHKNRFIAKPELYAGYVLDLKTLASLLTIEEAKDLVLRLARAEYLGSVFTYQKIEPLIKRIGPDERATFKKLVFVDRPFGKGIKNWQYPTPITFKLVIPDNGNIFVDIEHVPECYECEDKIIFRKMLKKRKYCKRNETIGKSPLEALFDKYRFVGFEKSFQELSKKLHTVSTIDGRMNILLVLVSKSGGVPEQVEKLLKLLTVKHINEPCNLRAAVVRSLVKRACVWRLPADSWTMFLEFGRDLGLDGKQAELVCVEGLHAVVLRHLINEVPLSTAIKAAFLNEISTLKEYKLNGEETKLVGPRLGKLLLDSNPYIFLNILSQYNIKISIFPDAETSMVQIARNDSDLARHLFESRIGRRYLLRETFGFIDNDDSFVNALRHDTSVLDNGKSFTILALDKRPRHDRFLQLLAIYFNEPNGLADQHKVSLVEAMKTNPLPWFARTVNILSTNVSFLETLKELSDTELKETSKKQLAAAFRATAHKCRPKLDISSVDWRWLGAKAIANRVFICRDKDRDTNIKLLLEWKATARIAIRLGLATKLSTETFIRASKLRPSVALKVARKVYLNNNTIDPLIWEVIKKLIENLIRDKTDDRLLKELKNNNDVPESIKAEYWQVLYRAFVNIDKRKTMPILCRLENLLPNVDDALVYNILQRFLDEELIYDKFMESSRYMELNRDLCTRIMVKYLLACKSESKQNERLEKICDVFFNQVYTLNNTLGEDEKIMLYSGLRTFIQALKYNKVFLGDYVSCIPVFERVLINMKNVLPVDQYFSLYVEIHLIMLYYKSLKQTMKQKPKLFYNLEENLEEAIENVGIQLGKNIGLEVKDLTTTYYFSIIDIYKKILAAFLNNFKYERPHNPIVVPLLKSLVGAGQMESLFLAQHVLCVGLCPSQHREEILNTLKGFHNDVVNMFLYACNMK